MKALTTKHLDYEGTDGQYHTIRPVNIVDRQMLLERLKQVFHIIDNQKDKSIPFSLLYNTNKQFAYVCNQCLELCGVAKETVSMDLLYTLLFPTGDEETGVLVGLNFSPAELIPTEKAEKGKQELADILGRLWAATEDFNQVYNSMIDLPAEDFLATIKARNEAIEESKVSPEDRKKRTAQNKAKEMLLNRGTSDNQNGG